MAPRDPDLPLLVVSPETPSHRPAGGSWRLALLLLAAAGLGLGLERGLAGPREGRFPEADPGPRRIHGLGRLEPRGEVAFLAAPSGAGSARIAELLVEEGQRVEAGQAVAVLDSEPVLAARLALARAGVEQALARVERTAVEVDAARGELAAELEAAGARVELARERLERREGLLARDATSGEAVSEARQELRAALAEVRRIEARATRYRPLDQGEPADLVLARRDLEAARAAEDEARALLADARIVAPRAGEVLDLLLRPGESVAGVAVALIGDTRRMHARVEVYESDVAALRVGQAVELGSAALPRSLAGRVERIASRVERQSVVDALPAASTDARVVEVRVALDEESSALAARLVGLEVQVEFLP